MHLKSTSARVARAAAVCCLGVAIGLAFGCRKSASKREEEQARKEEQVNLKERADTLKVKENEGVREYQEIKDMVKRGEYEEAWKKLEELTATDEQIKWQADMYKKNGLPDELFRQADVLSDIRSERYEEAYRRLQWVSQHIESKSQEATKRAAVVRHKAEACQLYRQGVLKVQQYRGGEAVTIFERVKKDYADTPYAALSEQRIIEIQGPPQE